MTIVPWVTVKPANSLLPRADQETMAAEIPGARLVIYDDVGHLLVIEAPERRRRPHRTIVLATPVAEARAYADRGRDRVRGASEFRLSRVPACAT